jgi:spore coat protein CotH
VHFCFRLSLVAAVVALQIDERASAANAYAEATAAVFAKPTLCRVQVTVPDDGIASLRTAPRTSVTAAVTVDGTEYREVSVRLKGSASFRPLEEKPAFTLQFGKGKDGPRCFGMRKIYLNNAVQDSSYVSEFLCYEMCREAGVPAPRIAFALVELNGRRLGLYVLKEGYTKDFLGLYFQKTNGNFYQEAHERGPDVWTVMNNVPLQRDSGDGSNDCADLQAIVDAAAEKDLVKRWGLLEKLVDVDRVISEMALEVMFNHQDGYTLTNKNFRLYHDMDADKVLIIPHGMDSILGSVEAPIEPRMDGMIATAIIETLEGRRRYRERFREIFGTIFHVEKVTRRFDEVTDQLRTQLKALDQKANQSFAPNHLRNYLVARCASIEQQLRVGDPKPLVFDAEISPLSAWRPWNTFSNAHLDAGNDDDGRPTLHIRKEEKNRDPSEPAASWRSRWILDPGSYRFEGLVRTAGVVPAKSRYQPGGVRLRVGIPTTPPSIALTADSPWTKLECEFVVRAAAEEVEFICELSAKAGEVWFDVNSIRIARAK